VRAHVLPHADPLAAMEDLLLRGWKGRKGRAYLRGTGGNGKERTEREEKGISPKVKVSRIGLKQ